MKSTCNNLSGKIFWEKIKKFYDTNVKRVPHFSHFYHFCTLTIGMTDLQEGAGSDPNDTRTSAIHAVQINVDCNKKNDTWIVYMQRSDSNWDSDLQLNALALNLIYKNIRFLKKNNPY